MLSSGKELFKPKTLFWSHIFLRQLQLTSTRFKLQDTGSREARFLKKLMTGSRSNNTKKKWFTVEQPHSKTFKEFNFFAASTKSHEKLPDLPKVVTGAREPEAARMPSGRVVRRVGVLNTVFLEHIVNILSTGELRGSEDIIGLGLEIAAVHVTPDFKLVNVYWYTSGSAEKEAYLEEKLKHLGPSLRHVLIALRVIGMVPPVQFVKDTKHKQLAEVERLFETADYGEDFVPTKGANLFRPSPTSKSAAMSQEVQKQIESLEASDAGDKGAQRTDSDSPQSAPEEGSAFDPQFMRQDILGVKRDRIMQNIIDIIENRKKRQDAEKQGTRPDGELGESDEMMSPEQLAISVQNQNARTEMFVKYLKMKQMEQSKQDKLESTEAHENKFYNSLREERAVQDMEKRAQETEEKFYKNDAKEVDDDYWSEWSDSESENEGQGYR